MIERIFDICEPRQRFDELEKPIGDLADKIVALIGRDVEILFDATRIRTQSPDIERLVADITKANDLLSWQPKTSLDGGLKQTIEWLSTD